MDRVYRQVRILVSYPRSLANRISSGSGAGKALVPSDWKKSSRDSGRSSKSYERNGRLASCG